MRILFGFGCAGGGMTIEATGFFSRFTIRWATRRILTHLATCPYCLFKKDPLTNREASIR